jgi:hypothetical protein
MMALIFKTPADQAATARDARIAAEAKIGELQMRRSALIEDADASVDEIWKVDAEIGRLAGQVDIFSQREASCLQKARRLEHLRLEQAKTSAISEVRALDKACVSAAHEVDAALAALVTAIGTFDRNHAQRREKWPSACSPLGMLAHFDISKLVPDGVRAVADRDGLQLAETVKSRLAEAIELVTAQPIDEPRQDQAA